MPLTRNMQTAKVTKNTPVYSTNPLPREGARAPPMFIWKVLRHDGLVGDYFKAMTAMVEEKALDLTAQDTGGRVKWTKGGVKYVLEWVTSPPRAPHFTVRSGSSEPRILFVRRA